MLIKSSSSPPCRVNTLVSALLDALAVEQSWTRSLPVRNTIRCSSDEETRLSSTALQCPAELPMTHFTGGLGTVCLATLTCYAVVVEELQYLKEPTLEQDLVRPCQSSCQWPFSGSSWSRDKDPDRTPVKKPEVTVPSTGAGPRTRC